jgi:hypothetical protein
MGIGSQANAKSCEGLAQATECGSARRINRSYLERASVFKLLRLEGQSACGRPLGGEELHYLFFHLGGVSYGALKGIKSKSQSLFWRIKLGRRKALTPRRPGFRGIFSELAGKRSRPRRHNPCRWLACTDLVLDLSRDPREPMRAQGL